MAMRSYGYTKEWPKHSSSINFLTFVFYCFSTLNNLYIISFHSLKYSRHSCELFSSCVVFCKGYACSLNLKGYLDPRLYTHDFHNVVHKIPCQYSHIYTYQIPLLNKILHADTDMNNINFLLKKIERKVETFIFSDKKYLVLKSKITKILNSEENSKRRVPYQMAKSKAQSNECTTI